MTGNGAVDADDMYTRLDGLPDPPIDICFVNSAHEGPLTNVSLCHAV